MPLDDQTERLVRVEAHTAENTRRLDSLNGQIAQINALLQIVNGKLDAISNAADIVKAVADDRDARAERGWSARERKLALIAVIAAIALPLLNVLLSIGHVY